MEVKNVSRDTVSVTCFSRIARSFAMAFTGLAYDGVQDAWVAFGVCAADLQL